ncbi:MAG TPA: hypothetical protein VME43_17435 [Bryobacteraceae bacterium]|nr:hypothetical protein [Bryobacteraceae bacterium]
MPGEEIYELYIDAFTPETIPMARLADYMTSLAELLGHREHVHFGDLKQGSLAVAARVDEVALRKVEKRLEEVRYGAGPDLAQKALREIDDKLAEDNAIGRILRGKAKLIEFPGRTRPVEAKLGPVEQPGALDGEIIQVGGRDETINVHLKSGDQIHFCVTSKAVARRLAPHIFGGPVRVHGKGIWARVASGAWVLKRFEIAEFETLQETSLAKMFEGLRTRLVPPEGGRMNPVDLMRQLREE